VPTRTNLFQEVVSIIHEHLSEGASRDNSAMLTNRLTGEPREVDVVLRSMTAGYETVIAIEATSPSRRAAVDWVEQMIGKHKNLPTNTVVLVSERGFTKQARALAIAENMTPISTEVLTDGDQAFRIVNSMRSLWPKVVDISPDSARVFVDMPGVGVKWFRARPDLHVFTQDGSGPVALVSLILELIQSNFAKTAEDIDLANIAEDFDGKAIIEVGPGWTIVVDGEEQPLYVQHADGDKVEYQRIDGMEITAKARIHVSEIKLQHRRLAEIDVNYAFGEGTIAGAPALIVATEDEYGGKLSIQLNPKYKVGQ
jgi:hypothetical protein